MTDQILKAAAKASIRKELLRTVVTLTSALRSANQQAEKRGTPLAVRREFEDAFLEALCDVIREELCD